MYDDHGCDHNNTLFSFFYKKLAKETQDSDG